MSFVDILIEGFDTAQQTLFETLVRPSMFALGMGQLLEDGYRASAWLLVGLLQLVLMVGVIGALQRRRPVEPVTDRAAVRVDVIYTLIHRLGLFRVAMFFLAQPLWDGLLGWLRLHGLAAWSVDSLWPGVTDIAWVSFLIYLVLLDAVDYGVHRAQHGWGWWWQLHALHHSQRQMTMWSDSRNHLLDDVLRDSVFVVVGLLIGIAPAQFLLAVALTQLVESLSHANIRTGFGPVMSRLVVSPQFHRRHHAIGIGHESAGPGSLGGCNYGVLFPWWDLWLKSAVYDGRYEPTGVRDQLPGQGERDYGRGFWAQQWLGLRRLGAALGPRRASSAAERLRG
jgi:sterol desaturase/sphingolipid hydroxylase (fatty acid hydroxylase superfamily)